MRKFLILSVLIFQLWIVPSYSFEINLGNEEIVRLNSNFLVKDLGVGDKITLDKWQFCNSNGNLAMVDLNYTDLSPSDYNPRFILTLLPSSSASLEVKPDNKDGVKYRLTQMIPAYFDYTCEEEIKDRKIPSAKIIFIKTVNGFDNLRDYVNHLKENGHKIRN